MTKILITGGAGFIGSNFIRFLINKYPDYKIINLDKLTYAGNLENLKDIEKNPNYGFVKGDICHSQTIEKIIKDGVDYIVNFAAETHVDRSIDSAGDFIQTNVYGTYVLLEAVRKFGIKRFLHISTDEIYGSIEKGSFREEDILAPSSPYSASKAAADLLVISYYKTYKLPVLITRSSNNYGPYQYPEKVMPLFITNALEDKKLPLYGEGKNIRDWLYVLDNCEAIDLVLHKGKEGEIYNIGGGEELKNIDLARLILKELGKSEGLIQSVKDRPGHDFRYSLDCSKIKKLEWKPKYSFEKGLKDATTWYKENKEWWAKIKAKQKEYKEFYHKWYEQRK